LQDTVEQQRGISNDLQNIFNSTDVATLFLDGRLNIRFFTPAAKSLFNIIASDAGRPLADLTRRFEDGDLFSDALTVLSSHAPVRREVKAHDGAWFIRGMLPYQSDGSGIEGVVVTFAGISEMKAAEREIEAAPAYLDSIIATIRQPLVVLDEQLRVISASSNDYEIDIELPTLGHRSFLMSARVLREEPLAKRKILVAIVDVTEAKREGRALETAKSEAEKANVGKSRFLAAASHDLRQPLQTISLLQGMLEKRVHDQATLKLVHRLDETVSTMSSMLDKLLDINQLEAGIVRPAVADFSIKHLLDEMRTEFAYHAAANRLDWRVVPSSLIARTDPRLLEQIIRNLLSNAVKYTTAGKLLLGCRRSGDRLRIEVWDTGPGIPEMELQAIFEEFHQLDNPARQRSKGLGLGLAIGQRLADLLGHKIGVRSRLGAGSVFTIEVPLGRAEATAAPVLGQAEIRKDVPARGTILIVDDDPVVLDMLRLLFDDQGQRTIVAADGRQALEFTEGSNMPDLIVAGYNLPNGITGLEVIARIQARAQHPIPAIILTGDISTESLRDIAGRGCVHLNKPVRAMDLTRLVQRLLAKPAAAAPDTIEQLPLRLGSRQSSLFLSLTTTRLSGKR